MWQRYVVKLSWILLYTGLSLLQLALAQGYREELKADLEPPRFLPTPTNYTSERGSLATLFCSIAKQGTKTVTWRRSSSLTPLTIGEMIFTADKDYQINHVDGSLNWNLQIKNVQMKHAGEYECQISTKDKMKRTVYLSVVDDHTEPGKYINISGRLHIDKGQPIILRCNASGATTPPDAIDWFKDGSKLDSDTRKQISITKQFSYTTKTISSEFRKASSVMEDTGTYTCRTTDLQVKSVNVNILNAEKPVNKRDDKESPMETKLSGYSKGGAASVTLFPVLLLCMAAVSVDFSISDVR